MSCYRQHGWLLPTSLPHSLPFAPSFSALNTAPPPHPTPASALLLEEPVLFLEMAVRSQPHKGQLSLLWPRSLGWLLCAQESSLAHLCPLLPASLLLAWPCPSGAVG